jgi:DNA (cytosine-5)-methyltransferase 1
MSKNNKKLDKVVVSSLFSKRKTNKKPAFKMIDLFAGIGGIRLGFEEIGGECVFTSEWDKFAQQTYQENFEEIPYGDITEIDPTEIPSFDVLLAGFPCQPFSQAGKKLGLADTRGTLFFDIARILEHHRPPVVFLENVKRFKSHDGGKTFETIKNVLENFGYDVHAEVLNAKHFGVPQNRERIYIIGFLGKTEFSFPKPLNVKTKLGDILEDKVDNKYTISDRLWEGHQRRKKEHKEKGNGFGYSMFDHDSEYTSTISARYYKDGSEILIKQKRKNPRKLTPREAARLQGFPDTFQIPVSDNQAYKQFGNSVAVPVIKALAKEIEKAMKKLQKNDSVNTNFDLNKFREESITKAKQNIPNKDLVGLDN